MNSVVYSYGRAVNAVLLEETEGMLEILDYFSIVTFLLFYVLKQDQNYWI